MTISVCVWRTALGNNGVMGDGWIKVQLKDKKTGYTLSNAKYTIYLLDGSEIKGTSDNDGIVYLDNIKFGKYFISIGV